jgi:hypothetical protein
MNRGPSPSRFSTAAAALALVGCLVAAVGPLVFDATVALRGSVVGSAVVGGIFAGYNLYAVRASGQPRLAAGVLTTLLGLWLIAAPLVYVAGDALTAVVQSGGSLVAAFGGYTAGESVELIARGTPLARNVPRPDED